MTNNPELNTDNPEYYTWQYEQLQIAILGGMKIEGLDRLRVTLKVTDVMEPIKPERKKEVEAFLKQPDLLQRINSLIGESGVTGEDSNRLLMYLVFTSRKREQPLHTISLGSSGTGKSHLQEKVGELMPPEDKIEITSLSENAFYYFGKQELKHKLILIEDLDGAQEVLYPLRELQSKKVINKTYGEDNKSFSYTVADQGDYQQMQAHITTILDQVLDNLKSKHWLTPLAQQGIEPVKPMPVKKKRASAH